MRYDRHMIIGRKLFIARRQKKLSRAKVAELMGVHETTVKRYEDGTVKALDVEKLKDFSKILSIPLEELIEPVDACDILEDKNKDAKNTFTLCLYDEINFLGNISIEKRKQELDNKHPSKKFMFFISEEDEVTELQYRTEIINPYFQKMKDIELIGVRIKDDSINKIAPNRMYAIVEFFGNIGDEELLENGNLILTLDKEHEVIFRHYSKHGETIVLTPNSTDKNIQPIVFFGDEINKFRVLGRVWGFITLIEEYTTP